MMPTRAFTTATCNKCEGTRRPAYRALPVFVTAALPVSMVAAIKRTTLTRISTTTTCRNCGKETVPHLPRPAPYKCSFANFDGGNREDDADKDFHYNHLYQGDYADRNLNKFADQLWQDEEFTQVCAGGKCEKRVKKVCGGAGCAAMAACNVYMALFAALQPAPYPTLLNLVIRLDITKKRSLLTLTPTSSRHLPLLTLMATGARSWLCQSATSLTGKLFSFSFGCKESRKDEWAHPLGGVEKGQAV